MYRKIYKDRRLGEKFPEIEKLYHNKFLETKGNQPDRKKYLENLLKNLDRITAISLMKNVLEVGCGPKPETLRFLIEKGYAATGIEPVRSYVESARAFTGRSEAVIEGYAQDLPFGEKSQDIIFCESVLEHADSPSRCLSEFYRVLRPGGMAAVTTTNRYRFSLLGRNGEYNIPFFNWFPSLLKECYAFHHSHYEPSLANYTTHPAVHWFSYGDLCKLGRQAGFSDFYSLAELVHAGNPSSLKGKLVDILLNRIRYSPFLRALFLTQFGGFIVMRKIR